MGERPYTVLSCAVSLDGYLDSTGPARLVLSNSEDLDRVDAVRASCDAILVGAATVRSDDPRLVVRDPGRVAERVADGRTPTPVKVTVTERGKLERDAPFFRCGDTLKLVYCTRETVEEARAHLGEVATVVDGGAPVRMRAVSEDLFRRGVRRLLVEGGGSVLTQFLLEQVADELHLVVAPFFVGDSEARRLVDDGRFAWDSGHRAALLETRPVGDVVLLRYGLSEAARLPAAGRQEQVR